MLSLTTIPTETGQRCEFKDGGLAGTIEYVCMGDRSERWAATPWACGDRMKWGSRAAAQYYILACAEQMIATGNYQPD